ncbi:hypothetical protein [Roseovarius aestuariivivens]|uniref:hypothetical protein n=1 Tax=Roseovarius aestuariivivens TaxID=1888910 RepID=UPI001080C95B|nr:hypothetical protein [Roseovarius aestuariivivens]
MKDTPIDLFYTVPLELRRRAFRVATNTVETLARRRVASFCWFLLVILILFGLVFFLRETYPQLPETVIGMIFLAGHIMAFVEWKLSKRRRREVQAGLWTRTDQASTTLNANLAGLKFISNDSGACLRSRAIEQNAPLKGEGLLRISTDVMVVPLLGLPAGETPQTILETFDAGRTAQ